MLGIIVLVVGGTVAGLGGSSGTLIGGMVVLIIGIALAVIGAATGGTMVREAVSPQVTSKPMSGGMGSGTMDDMVKMLASAPEAQRRDMIKTRLSSFAQMNDEERANGMKMMIGAVQKLDQEGIRELTYSRLEALAEDFDPATRKKLMGTHMMVVMGLPKEQMMAELNAVVSAMGQCHDACRMKDMGTMKELMMEMPQEKRGMMMQMLPPDVQKMLM
ncbi:MAG: hypothetical protein KGI38_03765 [Thaumarchaeota archaeon]|nr:hypothetical protein [Nitrososphaerota archaeon]